MKRKTWLIVVALAAVITALIYLGVLFLWQFGILSPAETEESLFIKGYLFLPVPIVGLLCGILLQVFSVRGAKKNKQ